MDQQQEWDAEVKVRDLDEVVGLQAELWKQDELVGKLRGDLQQAKRRREELSDRLQVAMGRAVRRHQRAQAPPGPPKEDLVERLLKERREMGPPHDVPVPPPLRGPLYQGDPGAAEPVPAPAEGHPPGEGPANGQVEEPQGATAGPLFTREEARVPVSEVGGAPPPDPHGPRMRIGFGPDGWATVEVAPGAVLSVFRDEPRGLFEASVPEGRRFGNWHEPDCEAPSPSREEIEGALSAAFGYVVEVAGVGWRVNGSPEFSLREVRARRPVCSKEGWPCFGDGTPLWHLSRLREVLPAHAGVLAQGGYALTLGDLDARMARGETLGGVRGLTHPCDVLAGLAAWWREHMAGYEPPPWLSAAPGQAAPRPEPCPRCGKACRWVGSERVWACDDCRLVGEPDPWEAPLSAVGLPEQWLARLEAFGAKTLADLRDQACVRKERLQGVLMEAFRGVVGSGEAVPALHRRLMDYLREWTPGVRRCRECGCTQADRRLCVERTGEPCTWVEDDLCSACAPPPPKKPRRKKGAPAPVPPAAAAGPEPACDQVGPGETAPPGVVERAVTAGDGPTTPPAEPALEAPEPARGVSLAGLLSREAAQALAAGGVLTVGGLLARTAGRPAARPADRVYEAARALGLPIVHARGAADAVCALLEGQPPPEPPWRSARIGACLRKGLARPLLALGVETLGQLADRAGEVVPRLESKTAKQALGALAAWWKDHTLEGQRGEAPPWEG